MALLLTLLQSSSTHSGPVHQALAEQRFPSMAGKCAFTSLCRGSHHSLHLWQLSSFSPTGPLIIQTQCKSPDGCRNEWVKSEVWMRKPKLCLPSTVQNEQHHEIQSSYVISMKSGYVLSYQALPSATWWTGLTEFYSRPILKVGNWGGKTGGGGLVAKSCLTLATPWTVARQASLSIGFSRQEYWSGWQEYWEYIQLPVNFATHHKS